ncbi:MAG: DUF1934 domain-containing protein [Lachnospiraceae bacterium]|jgi:uncharacterized beta-barrel protein YwiB (DUF1934 family)|uniref:DUF1934 domain-containing protein n=1 Tax=Candidatus Merdisoma sp. JLR.KK011 TaxID=3114299 RepID=UPI0014345B80|nr:DUF1934 domain-containing protein [Lachnospiraceae bacterium]MCI9251652.1 DUF1934 domain-containing protein [Lachnospiraceae bacterium]MCI9479278.1 DUF1934 domain-containing protein [Lachnospiraceae bacterium]MCI9622853.1 DUF1934 domain-containing protein [Lachnospiraceae bacterium]GFI08022.1 hypothetical protein IMSAGC007_00466 [Lachnospiraceae bacterium]
MTKEVLLTIAGLQLLEGEEGVPVEVVTAGSYYHRNGKHYILYDEVVEGCSGHIHNTVKIGEESLEVIKRGISNVHMVFEKNKKNVSCYATPFGNLTVGIMAHRIRIEERDTDIDVEVGYSLDVNDEYLADCSIQLNVKSKDAGDFRLHR